MTNTCPLLYGVILSFHTRTVLLQAQLAHLLDRLPPTVDMRFTVYAESDHK